MNSKKNSKQKIQLHVNQDKRDVHLMINGMLNHHLENEKIHLIIFKLFYLNILFIISRKYFFNKIILI